MHRDPELSHIVRPGGMLHEVALYIRYVCIYSLHLTKRLGPISPAPTHSIHSPSPLRLFLLLHLHIEFDHFGCISNIVVRNCLPRKKPTEHP